MPLSPPPILMQRFQRDEHGYLRSSRMSDMQMVCWSVAVIVAFVIGVLVGAYQR